MMTSCKKKQFEVIHRICWSVKKLNKDKSGHERLLFELMTLCFPRI